MTFVPVAEINVEYLKHGQILFVDTDNLLKVFGEQKDRAGLTISAEQEAAMKRYLIALALRER
jgi:hypothetical protein